MANYHLEEGQTVLITGPAKVSFIGDVPPVMGEAEAPTVTSLEPDTAVAGDAEDIEMIVNGTGFNEVSKIVFAGNDEPTTMLSPTQVRTIVKPSMFPNPDDAVPVKVRNGAMESGELDFSFTAAGTRSSSKKRGRHAAENDDD